MGQSILPGHFSSNNKVGVTPNGIIVMCCSLNTNATNVILYVDPDNLIAARVSEYL